MNRQVRRKAWFMTMAPWVTIVMLAFYVLVLSPKLARAAVRATVIANHATCPNELLGGFRSYLPDCRAYEMVTPSYKGGFPTFVEGISETGSQLEIGSFGVFAHPKDTGRAGGIYEVTRTTSGWVSSPFDAPPSLFESFDVGTISPDLTNSLWFASTPSQPTAPGIYLGAPPKGPFALVGPSGPASVGEKVVSTAGASRDLFHTFYTVNSASPGGRNRLWPGDKTVALGQPSLYEYAGTGNSEPSLVGVSNVGRAAGVATGTLISQCGTYLGGPGPVTGRRIENVYNAVSETGDTAFFTALGRDYRECGELPAGVTEPPVNEIYARMDNSQADAHTVAISEPSKIDCGECDLLSKADAEFQGASFDGSTVFFSTVQSLLPSATGIGPDLYEYNFNASTGKRVTLASAGDPSGARVLSVVRVSNDGSHIYFLAEGVLTATGNAFGKHAEEGAENLYVYEQDRTFPLGHLTFIGVGGVTTAQTTPDGRYLVFDSTADLTPDEEGRIEAGQVFEYDAQTNTLARVSKGANGYNDNGNSSVYPATIPTQSVASDLPREKFIRLAMSADGAYVFFTTENSLTPQAVTGATNVYESHEGHVALISDGHDLVTVLSGPAVVLWGTDESGRDVFFETADQLMEEDSDTQLDLYDARIEGGFPSPTTGPACSGESCQGPLSGGLQAAVPSTSLSGGENAKSGTSTTVPKKHVTKNKKIKKRRHKVHRHKAATANGRRR